MVGPPKAGIIGNTGNATICPLDNPILVRMKFLRSAVGTFDHIAVHQPAGTEEWRHAGRNALRQRGVAETLKNQLPREIRIDAFIKRKNHVGKAVERNRTHDVQMRSAVHREFER